MIIMSKDYAINFDLVSYIKKDYKNSALYFYFSSGQIVWFYCTDIEKAYEAIQSCIIYNNPSISLIPYEE